MQTDTHATNTAARMCLAPWLAHSPGIYMYFCLSMLVSWGNDAMVHCTCLCTIPCIGHK